MEAATLEQSSGDTRPVFVTGRRHRSDAVRLGAAALSLLLAGWLAALVAALVGFSPLPKLAFPGTGAARAPMVAPKEGSRPAVERDAGNHAQPAVARPKPGGSQASSEAGSAAASGAPSASGSGAEPASGTAGFEGAGSAPPASGGGATQAPASPGSGASAASSGNGPPSFTPPASGEKSASPPRGNSANAPGQTTSTDPPGRATRPNSG